MDDIPAESVPLTFSEKVNRSLLTLDGSWDKGDVSSHLEFTRNGGK